MCVYPRLLDIKPVKVFEAAAFGFMPERIIIKNFQIVPRVQNSLNGIYKTSLKLDFSNQAIKNCLTVHRTGFQNIIPLIVL